MGYITAIATANPDNRISQPVIAEFMLKTMQLQNGDSRKLKTIFRASGIQYRHSVLTDYGKTENFNFYPESDKEQFPSTRKRLDIFRKQALPLSLEVCERLLMKAHHISRDQVTHVVVVSCTGMYAPGLDIEVVKELKLKSTVHRTAINFMGCYAAFNALKIANAFCNAEPQSKVLIICVELCSLHFQREASEDNLLANALFADGAAAVLVEGNTTSPFQLELKAFHNELAYEGNDDMAWSIGDLGFEMRLSAYVPDIIKKGIVALTSSLLLKISKEFSDIKHFAIHPGGKKILEVIESELKITKDQNQAAYTVLQNFGNMSSATILFVLEEKINSLRLENRGEQILCFAFGPGLTMESMILQIKEMDHA